MTTMSETFTTPPKTDLRSWPGQGMTTEDVNAIHHALFADWTWLSTISTLISDEIGMYTGHDDICLPASDDGRGERELT